MNQYQEESGSQPEEVLLAGLSVDATRPEQPVLLDASGAPIRTWRENYPYDRKIRRAEYERTKRILQIELLKLQRWVKDTGARVVVICEGRDAAGKGGTIQRFTERLNPRNAHIVALDKPSEREAGQWYFQRYVAHLPGRGEIVFFDRSWYNRAGVEKVMGFCTEEEYQRFLRQCPAFEAMLVEDGVLLIKFWFSVSRAEQRTRFAIRQVDPCTPVEALTHRCRLPGPVGRLHHRQGRDVSRHRHRPRTVDGGQEQRQAAREAGGDAQPAVPPGLRQQGRDGRRPARPADRRCRRHPPRSGRGTGGPLTHTPGRPAHRPRPPPGPAIHRPVLT
ncbi:hypothetical protein GCM10020254_07850 [Streptomyces goshikiensis]